MIYPDHKVSFVLATHNRQAVVLQTLARIERQAGLPRHMFEIIVVDDQSTDGTAAALAAQFRHVRVIRTHGNFGPVSKNIGIARATGRYIVLLDDDSYPAPGAIQRMIRHFDESPTLGAAGFTVELPDGTRECSAYPDVFIGCGVGLRRRALSAVGGLPEDFFMQAEEYDLSLRLLNAGWDVQTFDDLRVTHLKSPLARAAARTTRLDVRNNIVLIARYFPKRYAVPYFCDWLRRYGWMAASNGHLPAFARGAIEGLWRGLFAAKRRPVRRETFERFARVDETEMRLRGLKDRLALKRVLLLDVGKNIYAYHRAARRCDIEIIAIADERLGRRFRWYRGVPVVDDATARTLRFDAAIVANLSPVHAAARRDAWRDAAGGRVIDLFARSPFSAAAAADLDRDRSRQTAARSA